VLGALENLGEVFEEMERECEEEVEELLRKARAEE
jgi:predicted phosphoribosyltransferase